MNMLINIITIGFGVFLSDMLREVVRTWAQIYLRKQRDRQINHMMEDLQASILTGGVKVDTSDLPVNMPSCGPRDLN